MRIGEAQKIVDEWIKTIGVRYLCRRPQTNGLDLLTVKCH